jgi:cystathionine gamma-synthase
LVFNPLSRAYAVLRKVAALHYEDTLYEEDAIFLERNSRDFRSRIERIDASAETLCDFLCQWRDKHARRLLQDVFYPKYETEELYRAFARHDPLTARPRYGGLFSLTFATPELAEVFYNHLPCCKGPSLGTNFTLASPYTLLAHYTELPWAAHWGVSATLVRVSVGLESVETLMAWFDAALMKTEAASQLGRDV